MRHLFVGPTRLRPADSEAKALDFDLDWTSDCALARRQLRVTNYCSLIVDQACDPEGAWLARTRRGWPLLPLLVLVTPGDASSINRCHDLRAECLLKPVSSRDLNRFLRRAAGYSRVTDDTLREHAETCAQTFGLTPREQYVMLAQLSHVPRAQMLEDLGISENTLKSQVKSLLRKTGHDSMDSLARGVLRTALSQAWQHGEAPTNPC